MGSGLRGGSHRSVACTTVVADILRQLGVLVVVEHMDLHKGRDCGCPFACKHVVGDDEEVLREHAERGRDGVAAHTLAMRLWAAAPV